MKIKEMTATFGKLNRASLHLGEGLNIVEAPNEGGKSTWSAFLRAMLYGIPSGQRDKAGFLAEKNRYLPWSGAPMEGTMTLIRDGQEIVLRRKTKGTSPFAALEAVDAKTGAPIPQLTADAAGPLLTGAEREVFERSAFVGQAALAVDGTPELEKRIAALLSSGLEEVSYSQVERQLKDWQNRRKHNKTGIIPRLELEIEAETQQLARFNRARLQREEGLRDLDLLRHKKAMLEEEKAAYKALAEEKKFLQYKAAYEDYQKAKSDYQQAVDQLGTLPPGERLFAAQEELQYIQTLGSALRMKEGELERLNTQAPPPPPTPRATPGPLLLGIFLGLAAALAFFFVGGVLTPKPGVFTPGLLVQNFFQRPMDFATLGLFSLSAGLIVLLLTLFVVKRRAGTQQTSQAQVDWEGRLTALQGEMDALRHELEDRREELLQFVHTFSPTATNDSSLSAALSRALAGEDKLSPLKATLDGAVKTLDLAKAALGPNPQPPTPLSAAPLRPYPEVVGQLALVNDELLRKERMVAAAAGELSTLGDPGQAEARLDAKEEELARRQEEYDALTLALSTLSRANLGMQARFSPALNQRAGEYMKALTGGVYDGLTLTRDFQAAAQEAGEVLPRSVLSLSQGTADQLYLAVRLAVCDLTLPHEAPPVLVLDDALANFDDHRLKLALDLLLTRSRDQQIILFTCHNRERTYLEGKAGVCFPAL